MRLFTALATAALSCCAFAQSAAACSSADTTPPSDEQVDAITRRNISVLTELFEGEIIADEGSIWSLRVGRVYRGSLTEGMILKGPPSFNICVTPSPRKGHKGVIWIGWGPAGPGYTHYFITPEAIVSLRRIGALPSYSMANEWVQVAP